MSRLVSPTGTKGPCPPAGPASRWTRDKSHLLSRAQRLPGQMAWNIGLFCSSERLPPHICYLFRLLAIFDQKTLARSRISSLYKETVLYEKKNIRCKRENQLKNNSYKYSKIFKRCISIYSASLKFCWRPRVARTYISVPVKFCCGLGQI